MTPERELLLQQATACRQLAMIAEVNVADQLKRLAAEYETLARVDRIIVQPAAVRAPANASGRRHA
jgi:hypothetical protein